MLILVTYDVSTITMEGCRRLRNVSKICLNYGQRVQNSVFECNINSVEYIELRKKLLKVIDEDSDSIRFYNLGKNYHHKVEHFGIKEVADLSKDLLII